MNFDKTQTYNEKIQPLVNELVSLCQKENIPIFISAAMKEENNNTEYSTVFCSSKNAEQQLTNDLIAKYILVSRGFHVHAFPTEIENAAVVSDGFLADSPLFEQIDDNDD